ncbi:hypothetical protein Tco_0253622, partial [Tanacetum coccineum]
MAGKGGRKKSNQIISGNEPSINMSSKKQKIATSTMSANTTT